MAKQSPHEGAIVSLSFRRTESDCELLTSGQNMRVAVRHLLPHARWR